MTPFDYFLMVMSTWAVLDLWFRGSLFLSKRAELETKDIFIARLLSCRHCCSYHVPYLAMLISVGVLLFVDEIGWVASVVRAIGYSLSVTGVLVLLERLLQALEELSNGR